MRTNHEYRASQARAKWGDLTHPRAIQINLRLTECSAHQRYDLCAWRVRLARDKRALLPQGCTGVANGRRVDMGQQSSRLDRPPVSGRMVYSADFRRFYLARFRIVACAIRHTGPGPK